MISLYILWEIRQLLLLLFTAVVLANALNILVKKIQTKGIKRPYAVLIAIFLALITIITFFAIIVPPFIQQFEQLALLIPQVGEKLNTWLDWLITKVDSRLLEFLPDINEFSRQLQPLLNQLIGSSLSIFVNTVGVVLSCLLLIVLTLMLLADPEPYRRGFIRLFPSFYRSRVDEILVLCDRALQGWLIGILFNMTVIAVLSFIGLLLLGIPLALAQAMLAGILTFIPNIGPFLSVLSPMAIALLEAPWKSLAVLIVYIVIQQVESNFLTPVVMAQQVALLPAITLLAQVFFATFFGFLGLFLALPLTVVGQVWLREVIVEDILDQWRNQSPTEPALIPESEPNLLPEDNSEPEEIEYSKSVDVEAADEEEEKN
ncbi:MAG: AI-2E family transporter [Cyanobacteria bacterium J083]|nr:MAG: AI-2E family transporter [Cyanobacteria bacterium J083]